MKKLLAGTALAVAAVVVVASPGFANAGGVPNNCVGATTSYVAQGNDISPFVSAKGIGNVGKANDAGLPPGKGVMLYIKGVVCG
jgi:hypothetical protein